jgi:signal transduction histidine kinase/ActR/RegA family two-component response regulator
LQHPVRHMPPIATPDKPEALLLGPLMGERVPLETVIVTADLHHRPSRAPDHVAENHALVALMKSLRAPAANILQELAETALRMCDAHSAGISIAENQDGRDVFRWHAAAGQWSKFLHNTMPREASPCGAVLDRNMALLMHHPERHFNVPMEGVPPVVETLLVPFAVADQTVGTVWVISHEESRTFDREDLRLLCNLSEFTSVAYQVILQRKQLSEALDREVTGSQLLQSISAGLVSEDDIGALYEQILDAATRIMRSQFASLQRVHSNGELQLLAWRGFDAQSARFWKTIGPHSVSCCYKALRARQRFIISDVEQCDWLTGTEHLAEYRRSGIRSVQSTPLISRSGELVGVVSTHWRERHTPALSDFRILDVLARETADLIERTKAEAALREADRRKDEFLAVLGHELRNPLAPLTTGIELLEHAAHRPELVQSVHSMMTRQVTHLTRLVDDLLDLSRISRGHIELRRSPIDMRVVIEAAVELARPLIDQRTHRLVVEHGAASLLVDGDLERLTQAIANLLTNAAKYMDPGGMIVLRSAVKDDLAVIRVQDWGFGIPQQRLEEVFEMFSQVPEHRARRIAGLGIGLALSRRLIEMHGGSVTATSEGLGQGSEFIVCLPVSAMAGMLHSARPQGNEVAGALHRRVLVVDDNVDAAVSLRAALQLRGHAVEMAHDAPASLCVLKTFSPEVVLLDIGLPEIDGYQLARHIRSLPDGDKLLLVAITGWGQEDDRVRAHEAGFDEHMTKPVSLQALQAAMARSRNS